MSINWIERSKALKLEVRNFIDGRRTSQSTGDLGIGKKFGPRDGQLLYTYPMTDSHDVDVAVTVAKRAFEDGRWCELSMQHRKECLHKLADLIDSHLEELALLECLDVGKPISAALAFDVTKAAAIIRFNAEAADKLYTNVYAVDASSMAYQFRRPVGVVGAIVGWNFPLLLAASKVGPALAAGNSVVLKPSELTSLSAGRLADLASEAGIPEGILNVIHGDASAGSALANHGDVDLITFTGSTNTGKQLLIASGQSNMKRLILECGGKAPNILFDDWSDLEVAAESIVARAFWNQGEVCTASSRLLIHEPIKEELLDLVIKKASAIKPGDPLKEDSHYGALVSAGHRKKVLGYMDSGEAEGARSVFQGAHCIPCEGGFYLPLAIFDAVSPRQKIAREEIFGPVLSVITFRDEEEAIRIANDTIYGLSAMVWTRSLPRAHRMIRGIKAGLISVHATERATNGPSDGVMAVGGHKQSGQNVEGGLEGLEAYTCKSAVQLFV